MHSSTDNDGTPVASYSFDFGDGSLVVGPQPGATASHTYTAFGTFTVPHDTTSFPKAHLFARVGRQTEGLAGYS